MPQRLWLTSRQKTAKCFAIKCLDSPDRGQFEKEVEMLRRFSNPTHEHLITLLATYEQAGIYYLIFPWAKADLKRYWRVINPRPTADPTTVLWLAKQCKGIAGGIKTIHKYTSSNGKLKPASSGQKFGHHGDIKPENVLWFPRSMEDDERYGTLELSDFGLAEFSPHHTVSMIPRTSFAASPQYRAPEVDVEGTGAIGRSYDVWTLGCLYLEFITWQIGGWDLVDRFAYNRMTVESQGFEQSSGKFFQVTVNYSNRGLARSTAAIKPVVIDVSTNGAYALRH